MTAKLYFCWEKTMSGLWGQVCYHGAPPQGDSAVRTGAIPVPDDMIDADRNAMFGALARKYPAPQASPDLPSNLTEEQSP